MHLQCLGQPLKHPLLNWTLPFIVSYGALVFTLYTVGVHCTHPLNNSSARPLLADNHAWEDSRRKSLLVLNYSEKIKEQIQHPFSWFSAGAKSADCGFLIHKFGHEQICSFIFCCRENQSSVTDKAETFWQTFK